MCGCRLATTELILLRKEHARMAKERADNAQVVNALGKVRRVCVRARACVCVCVCVFVCVCVCVCMCV